MRIPNKFNQLASKPDIMQVIKSATLQNAQQLNCMRIGIIQEFYPESLTAKVLLVNKKTIGQNPDGTQNVRDYAPIIAKVCYCNPFCTSPLTQGMECIVLFSDREIESWFINGDTNPRGYERMHDMTDAVAIVGIRSLPQMIQILTDCLHLFYGQSELQVKAPELNISSPVVNIKANSQILLDAPDITTKGNLNIETGQSAVVPCGAVTLTFSNGILTGVS